ncbi:MAG TPA: hypothetical protein VJV78_04050 [Polyangiales bacterium]|nr:hypothetical protein [Polyangiales bacterium]
MKFARGWVVVMFVAAVSVLGNASTTAARPITSPRITAAAAADVVIEQAQEMSDANLTQDYAALTDFMYPRLVKALGGRTATIAKMQREMAEVADDNFDVLAIQVVSATVPVEAGAELHSVVTCYQYMRGPGMLFRAKTYLIAASSDAGSSWTFINVPKHNPEAIRAIFPAWNAALKIPTPPDAERVSTDLVIERTAK